MKTPAPQRAAGRKKLAASHDALPDGSFPIPTVEYLKKAIRSVGRAPASKRPALKALIRKRARELGAMNEPGVKGTWAFQAANDSDALEFVGPRGYVHGWIHVGTPDADSHISDAKKAESAGDRGSAIRHLGIAAVTAGTSGDADSAKHLAAQRNEMVDEHVREHLALARKAIREGRSGDAVNHLNAATMHSHLAGKPGLFREMKPRTADFKAASDLRTHLAAAALGKKAKPRVRSMASNGTEGIELSMMAKTARVRGPGDVACKRTAPGEVTVTHKPTGMRIGKLTPARHGGWQGTHATGKATPASGSMTGALSGLIGVHNKIAASMPDAMAMPEVQAHAQHLAAMELAGSLPVSTPAVTSGDGPRVTTMGGAGKAKTARSASGSPLAGQPAGVQAVYRKLIAKGMKPAQALAMAKRAAAMHAKAAGKAA